MCGLAGFGGNFDKELLVRMNHRISDRGPGDAGPFYNARAGLGLAFPFRTSRPTATNPCATPPGWRAPIPFDEIREVIPASFAGLVAMGEERIIHLSTFGRPGRTEEGVLMPEPATHK